MSAANDLIECIERETGRRIDDENSIAMAGLFGAIARELGKSNHKEHDDVVAGVLVRHQVTPEYAQEQASKEMLANMLAAGFPPELIGGLT